MTETFTADQVREMLRARIAEARGKQGAVAIDLGVSDAYLSMVLTGKGLPGPSIARGLGLERVITWRKIASAPIDTDLADA